MHIQGTGWTPGDHAGMVAWEERMGLHRVPDGGFLSVESILAAAERPCPEAAGLNVDHPGLWADSSGKVRALVYHRYTLEDNDFNRLAALAAAGFTVVVHAQSWYNPGSTVMVVVMDPSHPQQPVGSWKRASS